MSGKMVISEMPQYCPRCGRRLSPDQTDFYAGCTHRCVSCGFGYVYIKHNAILEFAQSQETDANRYWLAE